MLIMIPVRIIFSLWKVSLVTFLRSKEADVNCFCSCNDFVKKKLNFTSIFYCLTKWRWLRIGKTSTPIDTVKPTLGVWDLSRSSSSGMEEQSNLFGKKFSIPYFQKKRILDWILKFLRLITHLKIANAHVCK